MIPTVIQVTKRSRRPVHRRPQDSETATIAVFVVLAVAVASCLALVLGSVARRAGAEQAERSFQQVAVVVAGSVVAPRLTPQLLAGGAAASGALGRAVDGLRTTEVVLAVTVRNDQGQVVWTDDGAARGAPLRPDQRTALRTGTLVVDPASAGGSAAEPVVASVGVQATSGTPLLVEVTGRRAGVAALARSVWTSFAPVTLAAFLVLELLQLPLVLRLAGRVARHRRAEAALRRSARAATAAERRRIGREVHDDVLPDLHGLVYELDAVRLSEADRGPAAGLMDRTSDGLRSAIRRLRALLLDLSQDRVPESGLSAALAEMAERMAATGVTVTVQAPEADRITRPAAQVLYRCAQETLRNVAAHSGAEHVDLTVAIDDSDVTMTVDDDGRGFEAPRLPESRAAGHLGLQALGDLVADSGGSLTASSSPGQGTRIIVRMPLDDVGVDMRVQQ
jgi:two-component system NarL family sensor kinase